MGVLQPLNAGSFFPYSLLSVFVFLALTLKVCRNRLSCHALSVTEPVPSKLSNFSHSAEFMTGFLGPGLATTRPFSYGRGSKEPSVPKPFRRISPNAESDAALVPACWTSDTWTDVNPRPA